MHNCCTSCPYLLERCVQPGSDGQVVRGPRLPSWASSSSYNNNWGNCTSFQETCYMSAERPVCGKLTCRYANYIVPPNLSHVLFKTVMYGNSERGLHLSVRLHTILNDVVGGCNVRNNDVCTVIIKNPTEPYINIGTNCISYFPIQSQKRM